MPPIRIKDAPIMISADSSKSRQPVAKQLVNDFESIVEKHKDYIEIAKFYHELLKDPKTLDPKKLREVHNAVNTAYRELTARTPEPQYRWQGYLLDIEKSQENQTYTLSAEEVSDQLIKAGASFSPEQEADLQTFPDNIITPLELISKSARDAAQNIEKTYHKKRGFWKELFDPKGRDSRTELLKEFETALSKLSKAHKDAALALKSYNSLLARTKQDDPKAQEKNQKSMCKDPVKNTTTQKPTDHGIFKKTAPKLE
jgi:paraquat-inducible protein B